MFQEVAPATYSLFLENQSAFVPASEATGNDEYHVFVVAGDSVFGDNDKFLVNVEIPISPFIVQFHGYIDKMTLNAMITAYGKVPFYPGIKLGEFKGNLLHGITIPVKIPKVQGSMSLFIQNKALWIKFDIIAYGKHRVATFKIMDLPFVYGPVKEQQEVLKGFESANIDAIEAA